MKKAFAVIERARDGTYSVYQDDDTLDYLVTGTGDTATEAIECFNAGYEDFKRIYKEEGKPFQEVEFVLKYDVLSYLSYYSLIFSLPGLSKITGKKQDVLSQYLAGERKLTKPAIRNIQNALHKFAKDLLQVKFF